MSHNSMPYTADVAQAAGVAVGTAPNGSARQLGSVRSRLIGMLAADLKDDFQLKIAQHVEAAAARGWPNDLALPNAWRGRTRSRSFGVLP